VIGSPACITATTSMESWLGFANVPKNAPLVTEYVAKAETGVKEEVVAVRV